MLPRSRIGGFDEGDSSDDDGGDVLLLMKKDSSAPDFELRLVVMLPKGWIGSRALRLLS